MTKNKLFLTATLSVVVSIVAFTACMAAEFGTGVATVSSSMETAPYEVQLFSLLINRKIPIDGKNHYQKDFDIAFDVMLKQSTLPDAGKASVSLKKRLLSGPQPDPQVVWEPVSGRHYVYYEACQAHACDETRLGVIYAPSSKVMLGHLFLDGKDEYLGHSSSAEKSLLDKPKNKP